MSFFTKLREAAEKSAKTNLAVYSELERQGMKNGQRMQAAGAGLGVLGMTGVMASAAGVQAATLGTGSALLTAVGQGVIAAGTVAGGIYVVPVVALGTAALGVVGLLASRVVEKNEYHATLRAREIAAADPLAKLPTTSDWGRGLKDVVSNSIRNAFASKDEKEARRLFDAVRSGDAEVVRKMVLKNPRLLHSWSDKGASPLAVSIARKQTGVTEVLFKAGARLEDRAHRDREYDLLATATKLGGPQYGDLIAKMSDYHQGVLLNEEDVREVHRPRG